MHASGRIFCVALLFASTVAGLVVSPIPAAGRRSTISCAAKPELTVCTGSVCSKHGTKEVQAAARKSGLAVKATPTCLKGCGKGVNVTAKGLGKRMLKGCSDPAKAQTATDQVAKKLGV